MERIGRYVKFTAQPGQGDALAAALLRATELAAEADDGAPELYLVNRTPADPDVVWVTEVWASAADAQAALGDERAKELIEQTLPLLAGAPELIELTPVGGVGLGAERLDATGFTHVALDDVEDVAVGAGFGEQGEARFATADLGAQRTGIGHQRLRPGRRQAFGHVHRQAEEICVVIGGSGRVNLDGEVRELRPRDALRIAPRTPRAFEAGPDGLEWIVMGPHHKGDGEILPGWWGAS